MAALLIGAFTAPAQAAGTCADDRVCMWEDPNYTGTLYVKYTNGTNVGNKFEIDGFDGDNEISSVINNTNLKVILYDNDNYSGTTKCLNPDTKYKSLGSYDNEAESFKLTTAGNC
jgi:hypothetical protein